MPVGSGRCLPAIPPASLPLAGIVSGHPVRGSQSAFLVYFFRLSHTHTFAHTHRTYRKLLLLMIIAGCTASAVSVPARGMRLLSPLPASLCFRLRLLLLLFALFVVVVFSLFSLSPSLCLFFRFIWPFIDIVNVIAGIAVVVFYSPVSLFYFSSLLLSSLHTFVLSFFCCSFFIFIIFI